MKTLLHILQNYRLQKKDFWIYISTSVILGAIFLLFPPLINIIWGIIENNGSRDDLFFWSGISFALLIIASVFWYAETILDAKIWGELFTRKYHDYRKILLEKNYKHILDTWSGKLISRFSRGIEGELTVFYAIIEIFTTAVLRGFVIIIILAFMLPELLWIVVISTTLIIILNTIIRKKLKELTDQENEIYESNDRLSVRIINSFLDVRLFGKKQAELKNSQKTLKEIPNINVQIRRLHTSIYIVLFFMIKSLEILAYAFIGYQILQDTNSFAFLMMITAYLWGLWHPIDLAINNINLITKNLQAYHKLQDFLSLPNEIRDGSETFVYKKWAIDIQNLDFSYEWKNSVLKNINISFLPGKKNALIGSSGGGKSTITKLLLRFFDYQDGSITIDGQDLKQIQMETLYQHIGYLPQEPSIFDGTIRENLLYAIWDNQECTEDQIRDALKKAQIQDMIDKLEKWLDTEVGERGLKLSGGEKQRLAIARLFLKNPDIIILDEPTSALDSVSKEKITQALQVLTQNKTSIIIAHRLQTIIDADQIILIDQGQVLDTGTHTDLITTSEKYKHLVSLQQGGMIQ